MPGLRSARAKAYQKLAELSVKAPQQSDDFRRLCETFPPVQTPANGDVAPKAVAAVPMTAQSYREFDVLVALCRTAPSIASPIQASTLLDHLSPYVSECCTQAITSSPFFRELSPCPWELLTHSIINAELQLGIRHSAFRQTVAKDISLYLRHTASVASSISQADFDQDSQKSRADKHRSLWNIVTLATSLLGFLNAAKDGVAFWTPDVRHELLSSLQSILDDSFLLTVEAASSAVRHAKPSGSTLKDLKLFSRHYETAGCPLGALPLRQAFAKVAEQCAVRMVLPEEALVQQPDILRALLSDPRQMHSSRPHAQLLEKILDISIQEIAIVDEGADYLQLGTTWQQQRAQALKASCLTSYLCCAIVDPSVADEDVLLVWLQKIVADQSQLMDETLGSTTLQCLARLAVNSDTIASTLSRLLPRIIVQRPIPHSVATTAAKCLLYVLRFLSQDTVITTLWGLGNSLSAGTDEPQANYKLLDGTANGSLIEINGNAAPHMSVISLVPSSDPSKDATNHKNIILAIVTVAQGFEDPKITALAMSLLIQKIGKVSPAVDLKFISEAAILAPRAGKTQFKAMLRAYSRIAHEAIAQKNDVLLAAVGNALSHLGTTLKAGTELYEIFLEHLLRSMIAKGDVATDSDKHLPEMDSAAQELAVLIRPLSLLVGSNVSTEHIEEKESFPTLQRDAWYNFVVHGFSLKSSLGQKHMQELKVIARYCEPLISEEKANALESPIDLNIVLKRGASSQGVNKHREELIQMLPSCESEIRKLDYPEAVFLKTAHLVESLRASAGNCHEILSYFVDPRLQGTALGHCLAAVALGATEDTLQTTSSGRKESLSAPFIAQQLSSIFEYCCHRVTRVQDVAYQCADRIIATVPSVLCQRSSIFALLDLLTIMWSSCLEADTNEYEWRSHWEVPGGHVKVRLSDNFDHRRNTLTTLHRRAREWVMKALNIAPLDVKGLLQTYLSDYREDDAFGHMSLGRSFAFEMGATIPMTDQRLGAIESDHALSINTASDFMAQYTSRQEYRYTNPSRSDMFDDDSDLLPKPPMLRQASSGLPAKDSRHVSTANGQGADPIAPALKAIHDSIVRKESVPFGMLRDVLRLAASLLCRAKSDHNTIISLFVKIPFMLFTKQSIKLGLSLWMGVIKENARMESRLLTEIIENWILTTYADQGMFDPKLSHTDPFYLKEEYAPSDLELITKQQQRVHDRLAPHFRIFQFLESHYSATRLNGSTVEKSLLRLLQMTLKALREAPNHPLSRELHFHVVLLALRVLRFSTTLDRNSRARLRDQILSACLAWFSNPARWSFGGSRLQVKAETQLLNDVMSALVYVKDFATFTVYTVANLRSKQELLEILVVSEQTRLNVWLHPLDSNARPMIGSSQKRSAPSEEALLSVLPTAWSENASLAINLMQRFRACQRLAQGVRKLIMERPRDCLHEPEALHIMFGETLPNDVTSQLKYLVYWAPVNPITAVTYFLPAYGVHPSIIQYAVRALESHSVDITFFYVPQIVQALRYDALGYVELYIIETAKFSQLFAHQIIWNIKANSYKDDASEVPDPMKPTLDKITERLIGSLVAGDKEFYEREFAFFNEITDISGKLRAYLGKSKPEKKQKIEEELRKINVDVGVYLPSNPDGVVVGIDRTSGKPLQSHAKTPYMATFRIRKERVVDEDDTSAETTANGAASQPPSGESLSPVASKGAAAGEAAAPPPNSYEVWQSAIFKVGDDCRQDMLALQMTAAFRGIFAHVGLPLYVFPYRVTATAPGCGVIDVLPRSISRDMLGREAVNGLYPWFVSKFGSEDSPAFQAARANFVKSLAAYSIISYLLQFKDRHNGNIMFDDEGHILHIDFGFCFDIAPGGVRFERAPFKLTREMLAVMGGSTDTQAFRWFEELCVKAFLAARAHVATLAHVVVAMLDSGLPCFKPETISHFRDRFVLDKTEREAADFVRFLVRKSLENKSTYVYDEFQLLTNGIPF